MEEILWIASYFNGNRETWDLFIGEEDYEEAKKKFFAWYEDNYEEKLDAEDFYDVYRINEVDGYKVKLVEEHEYFSGEHDNDLSKGGHCLECSRTKQL